MSIKIRVAVAKVTVLSSVALFTSLLAAAAAQASGKVEVQFIEPEKFADAGRYVYDRERTLSSLGDYMKSLGKELPDGQTLKLEVLDIDLAGTIEFKRNGEIRVLRDRADWPHIKLRYLLQTGGEASTSTLKAGTADLVDMNYMQSLRGLGLIDGAYGYEKRMVLQWFRQNMVAP